MSTVNTDDPGEKSRICPSCRMQISVLAVKCRFCGEEVGKPKEEQRSLSISDLGGETIHHRAPSGSVMEALESFRAEEGVDEPGAQADPSMEALETPAGSAIEDFEISGGAFEKTVQQEQQTSQARIASSAHRAQLVKLVVIGAVLIGGAIGIAVVLKGVKERSANAVIPVVNNRALDMLEAGDPPIDALAQAVAALEANDDAKNRQILDEVLVAVQEQVDSLLNKRSWNRDVLREAVSVASQAADLYSNEVTLSLREETQAEMDAYSLVLVKVEGGTASLEKPGSSSAYRVKAGEYFYPDERLESNGGNRFQVVNVRVTGSIMIKDMLRGKRSLRAERQGNLESAY